MKKFFGKQIIEAPRSNSSWARSAKVRSYGKITVDDEGYDYDGFHRLPVSRKQEGYHKKLGSKSFSDKLGPLENYLASSCGRLWDEVFSEISRELGQGGGWGMRHILSAHLDVETVTYRGAMGDVCVCNDRGVELLGDSYGRHGHFYVEPETGILRRAKRQLRSEYRKRFHQSVPHPPEEPSIKIAEGKEYRAINGIWYYQEFHFVDLDGGRKSLIVTFKKQLNRRELRDNKLKNGVLTKPVA